MKNSVVKTAIKFINKDIKKKLDFRTITECLKSKGYTVIFYNPEEGNNLIESYGLTEFSRTVKAFTVRKDALKIVFISSVVPPEDKLYLLLHEVGHIVLGHLNTNSLTTNSRLQDMEAEAFAYTLLNPPKQNKLLLSFFVIIIMLSFVFGTLLTPNVIPVTAPVSTQTTYEYVYITPSGKKFHRENCIYTQDKKCTSLTKEEAQKTHEPCLVCKP